MTDPPIRAHSFPWLSASAVLLAALTAFVTGFYSSSTATLTVGMMVQTARDDHIAVQEMRAANLDFRLKTAEASISEQKASQQRTAELLYSLDHHMAIVEDKLSSFDDKLALVASHNLPRGRN